MMKIFRLIFLITLAFPLYANAWVTAAFSPSTNHVQVITKGVSQTQNTGEAISTCNKKTGKMDCVVVKSCDGPTALVIFRGDGGVAHSCNPNPKVAYEEAKDICYKNYQKCRPLTDLITWDEGTSLMVLAFNKDNVPMVADIAQNDADSALVKVLEKCKKTYADSECTHANYIETKWWAVDAFDNQDKFIGYGVSTTSKEAALSYATKQCTEAGVSSENCKFKYFEKPDNPAPKSFADIVKVAKRDLAAYDNRTSTPKNNKLVANNSSCRPNTTNIRCRSNCVNGNCVVTYENGCKMTVQVQPKLNPFTNQFEFPSPSC